MRYASQKATYRLMLCIIGVAFLLRTATLAGQSLWRDEVDAIIFSSWALPDLLGGLFRTGHNGPLFYILLRPWRNLVGDSEFALRFPSAVAGVLVVAIGFRLARRLGLRPVAATIVSLLLTTSPYQIWYSQEAKMYTILTALIGLAMWCYLNALRQNQAVWWVSFTVLTSLSFYMHILSPLMLPVYGLIALYQWRQWRRSWTGWLISILSLTLPYAPLAAWQVGQVVDQINSGHPFYPLNQELQLLLQVHSSGLIRLSRKTGQLAFLFLLLCGLFLPSRTSNASRLPILLVTWFFVPAVLIYLISLRVPIFEDRYLIYVAFPFYLTTALGVAALRRYSRAVAALALGLILVINLIGVWQQQRQPIKADFRAAAQFMNAHPCQPTRVMVQTPYLNRVLRYYHPDAGYQLVDGLWTNDGKPEIQVALEMARLTKGYEDMWLVVAEEDLWDQRHLVRQWLNENTRLVLSQHFMRVDLYYYRFDQPAPAATVTPPNATYQIFMPLVMKRLDRCSRL